MLAGVAFKGRVSSHCQRPEHGQHELGRFSPQPPASCTATIGGPQPTTRGQFGGESGSHAGVITARAPGFTHDQIRVFGCSESCWKPGDAAICSSPTRLNISSQRSSLSSIICHFSPAACPNRLEAYLAADSLRRESGLTPRERLVLQLIAEGHSNNEIRKILNPSVKTVESHRATAMRKLHVTSTATVVRYAVRNKLIEP